MIFGKFRRYLAKNKTKTKTKPEPKIDLCNICVSILDSTDIGCINCKHICNKCLKKTWEYQIDKTAHKPFQCPLCLKNHLIERVINQIDTIHSIRLLAQRRIKKSITNLTNDSYDIKKWKKKAGAVQCPNCSVWVEKNGGCPSMICSWCGVTWCWNCKKIRQPHTVCCKKEYNIYEESYDIHDKIFYRLVLIFGIPGLYIIKWLWINIINNLEIIKS
jgi:hypothetical protein